MLSNLYKIIGYEFEKKSQREKKILNNFLCQIKLRKKNIWTKYLIHAEF